MPGRKSINAVLLAIALGAAANPQSPRPASPTAKRPGQSSASSLGPHAEFIGWQGETALFKEETNLPNTPPRTAWYALRGSRVVRIAPPKSGATRPGRTLLSDFAPVPGEAAVQFQYTADPNEEQELGSAIAKWSEEGSGQPRAFPIVHATLTLKLTRNGRQEVVWSEKRDVSAIPGEAGYLYSPPHLRFAALSPSGAILLAELVNDAGAEFIRVPLGKRK